MTRARDAAHTDTPSAHAEGVGDVASPTNPVSAGLPADAFPLSSAQRGLWFAQQLDPEIPINIAQYVELHGELDVDLLEQAMIVAGKEIGSGYLRILDVDGVPYQLVDPDIDQSLVRIDLSGENDPVAAAHAWMQAEYTKPLDLLRDELILCAILTIAPEVHYWYSRCHHVALDGMGAITLMATASELYTAAVEGTPLPTPGEHTLHQLYQAEEKYRGSTRHESDRRYWTELLSDRPETGSFAPRTSPPRARSAVATTPLDDATVGRIPPGALAPTTIAAFAAYFGHLAGSDDVMLSLPVSARTTAVMRRAGGMVSNVVPLRVRLSPEMSVGDLVKTAELQLMGALRHQRYRTEDIRRDSGIAGGDRGYFGPIVNIMMGLGNLRLGPIKSRVNILSVGPVEDLALALYETGSGSTHIDFIGNPGRYSDDELGRHHQRFADFYGRFVAADPSVAIADLDVVGDEESAWLRNRSGKPGEAPRLLGEIFADTVERCPDTTAVVFEGIEWTYRELDRRTNRLARLLLDKGIGPESLVALALPRSLEFVEAVWAVVKTGAAFVPIDPSHPADRIAYMIGDAGIAHGLSLEAHEKSLPETVEWIHLDATEHESAQDSLRDGALTSTELAEQVYLDSPAYAIYTSGSTGRPKGVLVTHEGLANLVSEQAKHLRMVPGSRVLQIASPSFDASVAELMMAFGHEATLVVAPPSVMGGVELSDFLREKRVTHACVTPGALAGADPDGLDHLELVSVAGDVCPPELVARWSPGRRMLNLYGPTEATVWTTATGAMVGGEPITIGEVIGGVRASVLNSRLEPVPVGVSGELYLAGLALARGYQGRPGLTAERFIADPVGDGERMYRTGDVVRWTADGELEYVGRADFQVKVRGFRIELGEIDEVLASHTDVEFASAQVRTGAAGQKVIVGYVLPVENSELDATELSAHAAASLPPYMVPTVIITLDEIPLTVNGKLDRAALPDPMTAAAVQEYIAPRSANEHALVGVLEDVLSLDRIGMADNIFSLGADSLLVLQIRSRLRSAAGLDLSLPDVFASQSVADLAVAARPVSHTTSAPAPLPRPSTIPLSYPQTRLWILNRVDPAAGSYNIPGAVRLPADLDTRALEAAIADVVGRHEALRTTFPASDDGTPEQVVHSAQEAEARGIFEAGEAAPDELEAKLIALAHAGFDLVTDLPARIRLIRVVEGDRTDHYVLVMVMHHIVSDGASLGPLIRDLLIAYGARATGAVPGWDPLPIQYVDYTLWQRDELGDVDDPTSRLRQQLDFWSAELAGLPDVMTLPPDHPRPATMTGAGAYLDTWIDADSVAGLRQIAASRGITLFSVFQAVTAAALARFSGVDDTVLGTAVAGRDEGYLTELVGMFVNNVVLRQQVDQKQSVAELLDAAHQVRARALSNADAPFDQIVDALKVQRSRDHSPLFQFQIVMQHDQVMSSLAGRDDIELLDARVPMAKFDMSLAIVEYGSVGAHADEVSIEFEYATDLYDPQTVERFAAYLHRVLRRLAAQPERLDVPVIELFEFAAAETGSVLESSAGSSVEFPAVSVSDLVTERIAVSPQAVALEFEGRSVSYGEFGARVAVLARELIAAGVGPETAVGVCVDRSVEMVVAIHAVVAAGGQYVPIDTSAPVDRAGYMLETAGGSLVLVAAGADVPAAVAETPGVRLIEVDASGPVDESVEPVSAAERLGELTPSSAAYTLFTSGSTGRPKGVTVSHEAIVNRLLWGLDAFAWGPGERVILKTPYTFDVSLPELFAPLIGGATVVVAAPGGHADPEYLAGLLESSKATSVHFVPSMLSVFLDVVDRDRLTAMTSLRWLFASGEALPPATVAAAHGVWPQAEIHNLFGPTEAAVEIGWADVSDAPAVVSIGRPVPNSEMLVLDGRLRPVPVGVPGELYLGGVQLARGYAGRADLTADRFIADPYGSVGSRLYRTGDLVRWNNSGDIEYLGRTDFQVKLRGQRIELGEIEAVLAAAPGVVHAAATVSRVAGGAEHLVAYVSAGGSDELDLTAVKAVVRESLPGYMVPTVWMVIDEFVLSTAGKIDRKALPKPELPDAEYIAPRDDTEEIVADAFADVLGVSEVSVTESFFDLGGNSLSATQVVARLGSALDRRIPVAAIFEASSVAEFAEYIGHAQRTTAHRTPLRARESGDRGPLSTGQRGMWLINRAHPESSVYNVAMALRLVGELDGEVLRDAVTDVLDRHESLRTYYPMIDGEPMAVVLPTDKALGLIDYQMIQDRDDPASAIGEITGRGFDVTVAPPVRMAVIEIATGEYVLAVVLHHITADGVSTIPLAHDLMASYSARVDGRMPDLSPLPVQYLDFSMWQQELLSQVGSDGRTEEQRQLDYWIDRLSGAPAELGLPLDRPRPPTPSFVGGEVEFEIPGELMTVLDEVARDTGSTLFMVCQTAFTVLLSRLTAGTDIVVGTPYGGRDDPALDHLVGMFVNTLALRTQIRDDEKFSDLLTRVRTEDLADMDNAVVPFDTVVSTLLPRIPTAFNPVYQAIFAFQNFYFPTVELPGLTVSPVSEQLLPAKVDLQLTLYPTDPALQLGVGAPSPMRGSFVYATDVLDHDTVEHYAKRYLRVLSDIAHNPNVLVSDISIAIPEDISRVADPAEDAVTSLSVLVTEAAAADPAATAIVYDGVEVSFDSLSAMTTAMAAAMPDQDSAMTAALIGLAPGLATVGPDDLGEVLDQLRHNSSSVLGMTTR